MTAWLVVVAVGAGTYALRASMFVLLGGRQLPAWTATPMALVAPAAVAAMVTSMTLTDGNSIEVPVLPELLAMAAGFIVVRRTSNVMHAITVGMPALWLLTFIGL